MWFMYILSLIMVWPLSYCLRHSQSDDTYDSYCYELLFSDSWNVCLLQCGRLVVVGVFVIITIVTFVVAVVICMIEWIFNILPLVKSYAIKKAKCYDHLSSRNCYRILFTRTMHNHQYNERAKGKVQAFTDASMSARNFADHWKRHNTCRISIV